MTALPALQSDIVDPFADLIEEWSVSVSFGRSRSENFPRALYLAKRAPEYYEADNVYQATYRAEAFLDCSALLWIVRDWKSTRVAVCGRPIDRQSAAWLDICFGLKCRSPDPDYCADGHSMITNPFRCHRFMTVTCYSPWWTYGRMLHRVWHVDSDAVSASLKRFELYAVCPALTKQKAVAGILHVSRTIDPRTNDEWMYEDGAVAPKCMRFGAMLGVRLG